MQLSIRNDPFHHLSKVVQHVQKLDKQTYRDYREDVRNLMHTKRNLKIALSEEGLRQRKKELVKKAERIP